MQTTLESTLESLVAIPSITSSPEGCLEAIEFIRSEIETLGLFITSDTTRPHPWLIATTKDTKEPDIMLVAHLDVVPGMPELFTMKRENGKLYGRGVYDMKLAAACYITFFKAHAELLHTMNIGLMFTTDEEGTSASVPEILALGWRPKMCFIPDGGDDWYVEERVKGFYHVELVAVGKAAHGSRPWAGDNALHRLMDVLTILRHSFPAASPGHPTLTVNEFHAGTALNQIADYASAKIDFRSFNAQDIKIYQEQLKQLADSHAIEVHHVNSGPSLLLDKTAPAIQEFLTVLAQETGTEAKYCDSYGASDARFFAEFNIPSIIIEPHGGGRHSPDEWLLAEDLLKYYRLIEKWLLRSVK